MHRVLPDPSVSIAFQCTRAPNGLPSNARIVLIGEKTRPKVFSYERRGEIAAVRIKVEWVERLLGIRPSEHADEDVDLAERLPELADRLLSATVRTRTPGEAIDVLRAVFERPHQDDDDVPHAVVAHALDAVRRTRGRDTVEHIAERAGFSVRHLRRLVHDATGLSLKGFARTLRFVSAVTTADAIDQPRWADIAAAAGYYDQSHLVRDCRDICGLAPGELYRERRAQVVTTD